MKLITKTQTYYLGLIVVLLIMWAAGFLLFISWELNESTDDMLESDLETIISELERERQVPEAFRNTSIIQINPIPEVQNDEEVYADVTLPDPEDGEMEEFREIRTQVELNGQPYRVILRKSQVEYDDMFSSILIALLIFIIVLTATIAVANRQFLQRIWDPFYDTLTRLAGYSIQDKQRLKLKETNIDEFQELNAGVEKLLARIKDDYRRLKQFTENASHEIQTPLSVIQNQIELLIQDEQLSEQQQTRLGEINRMSGRLSRLNSALLLLTKIENEQYAHRRQVNLTEMLEDLIGSYRELAKTKYITIHEDLQRNVALNMNPDLAEMLFRNLLSNAIKHNHPEGAVEITLTWETFSITNTGPEPEGHPSQLFERFRKGKADSDSLGLGLSIVRTIVTANDFKINYRFEEGKHTIELMF